ncbi:hypothetical protein [Nigerium massiliense]|uniref:hypothetical protein n=1 Tax=Nigerium massiliense TaxID=1522317 RepID=UPI000590FE41|nr:hypothetical protein [Nigerium massiliense]
MSDGQVSETQDLSPEPDDVRTDESIPDAGDANHAPGGRPKDYAQGTGDDGLAEEEPTIR